MSPPSRLAVRRGTSIAAIALAVAACAGCGGGGGSTGAGASGIRGAVSIGPTCPVQRVGQSCADRPFATGLRVVDAASGEEVATVSSGEDGRFEIALPPGRYRLEPESGSGPPSAAPVGAKVPSHGYARATIRFDSGIR